VPTIWFYSRNDSYFGPELARRMAREWGSRGGAVEANILPAYSNEGHSIADDRAGWELWGDPLDRFLSNLRRTKRDADVIAASSIRENTEDNTPASPASLVVPAP
jgi:hypothetical protein